MNPKEEIQKCLAHIDRLKQEYTKTRDIDKLEKIRFEMDGWIRHLNNMYDKLSKECSICTKEECNGSS